MRFRWAFLIAFLGALLALHEPSGNTQANELVEINSQVLYRIRPDLAPVHVTWDVTVENNDPATTGAGDGETVFFYENLTIPVLKGASGVSAVSSSGTPLTITIGEPNRGPSISVIVSFDAAVFYGESYSFRLEYDIPPVRDQSLLVTPTYVYLPLLAGGDNAEVTVDAPAGNGWSVSLEGADCAQDGASFACSGEDASFLAGLAEVSRPDALSTIAFDVPMQKESVAVSLTFFQGEEFTAQHLRELITAGLPVIESLFGFPYPGSPAIEIAQGGRQVVLGYEGLTSCESAEGCRVVVSPVADDVTVLHELVHLWSSVHGKRWLSEGFAQLIADEAAAALPPGLVQTRPPEREPSPAVFPLDEWGDVSSLIGAAESEVHAETAGYQRSLQFVSLLRSEVGADVLRQVNAALAEEQAPVDSKRFLDVAEEISGKRLDHLFGEWVFSPSLGPTLAARRDARQRLDALVRLAARDGLPKEFPDAIRDNIAAWNFDDALAALAEAEGKFDQFKEIKAELAQLTADAEGAGLALPASISDALARWEFGAARLLFAEGRKALDSFRLASERVGAPRDIWQKFGLIGSDPDTEIVRAADAFTAGEFQATVDRANHAATTVDNASESAIQRLLLIASVCVVIAIACMAVWVSQRREREFAEL